MSSKEQYKDALKQKTRIIADQGKKITELNIEINSLSYQNRELNKRLRDAQRLLTPYKKWWQFWK
jgi:predicted RNase H-like nuclease (RuvC/YqgF family)